jgi:hypothetical protein
MRWMLSILGLALALLAASGLATRSWLAWTDLAIGIAALLSGAVVSDRLEGLRRAAAAVLGVGCVGLWLGGLAAAGLPWLPWFTLAFGVGFLVASSESVAVRS